MSIPDREGDGSLKQEESRSSAHDQKRRRWLVGLAILGALVLVLCAVLIPVGIVVIGGSDHQSSPAPASTSGTATSTRDAQPTATAVPKSVRGTYLDPETWVVTQGFNTSYTNTTVGGLSIMGLNSTWDDTKRANAHVPALNEAFPYGNQTAYGVNIGGWLSLEPFITPSFFGNTSLAHNITDEYSLSRALRENSTLQAFLERHYDTFVTEETFAEISAAGLDHVRIPYPYWIVHKFEQDEGSPYLFHVGWRYLLRGIEWARKYGLRVNLDLHAVPGNQNSWNHGGRTGELGWLHGPNGTVNGELSLQLHSMLSAFFAQERYRHVVTMYGLVNEPNMLVLERDLVVNWTRRAYGIAMDNGLQDKYIMVSDGFQGLDGWRVDYPAANYSRIVMDGHEYIIFNLDNIMMTHQEKLAFICQSWSAMLAAAVNTTLGGFGPVVVGEFSLADTDCTPYVNNVNDGARWDGTLSTYPGTWCPTTPNCTCGPANTAASAYTDAYTTYLARTAEAQFETFGLTWGHFYWTWDTQNATQWSYKKSMQAGIISQTAYNRSSSVLAGWNCSSASLDYAAAFGLPESY